MMALFDVGVDVGVGDGQEVRAAANEPVSQQDAYLSETLVATVLSHQVTMRSTSPSTQPSVSAASFSLPIADTAEPPSISATQALTHNAAEQAHSCQRSMRTIELAHVGYRHHCQTIDSASAVNPMGFLLWTVAAHHTTTFVA
eukprot:CAMPEP_0198121406 /NCGR_PEP_ID=MMETSP1442-20131203/32021_1 /TAXON_ID= /ORGANISM="Craspedostauros australis, Strain CCMP3328" /LENGTH=142 /DNA_ID=CAMNT_0043780209 /DNA_START=160 /DNA_END=590 /DNA_ORIENTATION=+